VHGGRKWGEQRRRKSWEEAHERDVIPRIAHPAPVRPWLVVAQVHPPAEASEEREPKQRQVLVRRRRIAVTSCV
jgi:hypothetical protein